MNSPHKLSLACLHASQSCCQAIERFDEQEENPLFPMSWPLIVFRRDKKRHRSLNMRNTPMSQPQ